MIPEFPVYLFDVDGTLVDSAADICGAIQEVLKSTPRNDVDDAFLRRYIGYHLKDLFVDLFPGITEEGIDKLVVEYRCVYPARKHSSTKIYPGVLDMLQGLGGKKGTATTKNTPTVRHVLETFELVPYFDLVQGTDGFPAKPEPDILFRCLDHFGVDAKDCLFIGDSAADMEAGRRAGVKVCGVRYGYGNLEHMARWEPDYWIDHPHELLNRRPADMPESAASPRI